MKALTESVWVEACLVLSIIANVLYLVAFIGNGWGVPSDPEVNPQYEGIGLWRRCMKDSPDSDVYCVPLIGKYDLPGWFISVQALITTSLVGLFISLVIGVLYTCIKRFQYERRLLLAYPIVTFIFATLGAGGAILFGIDINDQELDGVKLKVSWSYIIACVTIGIQFLCSLLASIELFIGPRPMSGADTEVVISNASEMASSQPESIETAA